MPPTLWTLVLSAGEGSSAALEQLCKAYWRPINAYMRGWGNSATDAEDLTQMFMLHLLERNRLARARPERGRFRSYVLTAAKHFLLDQKDKANCKRSVENRTSADPESCDQASRVPDNQPTPDHAFDRAFALELIRQASERVEKDYAERGQSERFQVLQRFLPGRDPGLSQAEAGVRLGLSEAAVARAVHDLRKRFAGAFRMLVGQTVASYEEVDEEIAHYVQALSQH